MAHLAHRFLKTVLHLVMLHITTTTVSAQTAPTPQEIAGYKALHAAAHEGDLKRLDSLLESGADTEVRDGSGRTPLTVGGVVLALPGNRLVLRSARRRLRESARAG